MPSRIPFCHLALALTVGSAMLLAGRTALPAGASAPRCGGPSLPACPMQQWMRDHVAVPYAQGDLERLAGVLDQLVEHNPRPGKWHNWKLFCQRGARAARAGSRSGAAADCTHCHDTYRRGYNLTCRERPVPPPKQR